MAIVSIPLLGQASGKFSDSEFLRLNSQNILRSSKLKRYKKTNVTNLYYQNLLKKIVASLLPLKYLIKDSYHLKKSRLNYFCKWISDNYHLFSLNINDYLFCSDIASLSFSRADILDTFYLVSIDVSNDQVVFSLSSNKSWYGDDFEFSAVFCTPNFRRAQVLSVDRWGSDSMDFTVYTGEPLFNSSDWYMFFIAKNTLTNQFSNSQMIYYFTH